MKEVLSMINSNMIFGPQAGFGMPASARVRNLVSAPVATGVVSALAAGPKSALIDADQVCGYRRTTDAVATGVFPGTSAWSPPNC